MAFCVLQILSACPMVSSLACRNLVDVLLALMQSLNAPQPRRFEKRRAQIIRPTHGNVHFDERMWKFLLIHLLHSMLNEAHQRERNIGLTNDVKDLCCIVSSCGNVGSLTPVKWKRWWLDACKNGFT
jgi:hypothetical protein